MKRLLIAGLVMLVAVSAFAGGNPAVKAYIDFAPPGRVHAFVPAPYQTFDAFICFGDLDMGLTSASFALTIGTGRSPPPIRPAGRRSVVICAQLSPPSSER